MLQRRICQQKNLQDVYNINHNDADILLNKCKISINMNFHIPSNHSYYEIMKIAWHFEKKKEKIFLRKKAEKF